MIPSAVPDRGELGRLAEILGPAAKLTYAPPNIYPMSAPRFSAVSASDRRVPHGGRLGLYVHIPFCNYHCSFCFYATKIGASEASMQRYVRALQRELDRVPAGTPLAQMYVGGGTPTALPADLFDEMLHTVFERFNDDGAHVHTVEGSPESLNEQHLDVLRRRGIERVSMGVQSLSPNILDTVHRNHEAAKALDACHRVVASGRMLNVDLIYGLPGQCSTSFRRDFATAADAGVHSVTAYNLRVNERTPVARHLADDERLDLAKLVEWRSIVRQTAHDFGFERTRWHTFRRRECSTAQSIVDRFDDRTGWGNQFGIGMSARSRLDHIVYRNQPKFSTYLNRLEGGQCPVEELMVLDEQEQRLRFVALTLGDGRPLDRAAYLERFGTAVGDDYRATLEKLDEADLVNDDGSHITLTDLGQLVYDLVMRAFYPDSIHQWLRSRQDLVPQRHRQ